MTGRIFWVVFSIVFFVSCEDKSDKKDSLNLAKAYCDQESLTGVQMCTEIDLDLSEAVDGNNLRAVVLNNKLWNPGDKIKIKFLNGDSFFQEKVKYYSRKWLQYANLQFEFVSLDEYADIKVAFKWDCDYTTWSMVGTDCLTASQYSPSMNFGWLERSTTEKEFQRVIIHEFGHALGLVHEHQHPESRINWDEDALYSFYESRGWSKEMVKSNIIDKYDKSQTNYSEYDESSIMLYAIYPSLTLDGYSVEWNYELSATDTQFIETVYPK